ncbi:MAG: iron-containing alcohol dehydrogenase [Reyranella sp.]|uniref:iron-containing alcohol dehydrogenase family protein n=1 Tax=Reyranella sp. TaxID=1929291 RepID=UPI0025CC48D7|nr:iron-containing alcohol dehydrogenase family protein [Reyranella sp.]MBR2818243.1 iron-containing alcohol dehydrogenase [Reyranella sp.]
MVSSVQSTHDFRLISYPVRVYSGQDALDSLPAEVGRHRAKRVFVVCGRSVSRNTTVVTRIRELLGERFAGLYDEMGKDSPIEDVVAARDKARAASADLLIAVGAGSVLQGTRVVAVLLAESEPVEQLITQYPPGRPAISPKLMAPKLPIINVLTVGSSAQNRAGSAVKSVSLGRRMEFFDPKTRPVALFWDDAALLTAPVSMVCASGGAIYWRAVMNMGYVRATSLAESSRRQAFELTSRALPRLKDPQDVAARNDLCLATFLQNREVDDGAAPVRHWVSRVVYAFASSLFNLHEHVSQGAAHCALTPTVMRRLGSRDPQEMCAIARALGVWKEGDPVAEAPLRAADHLEKVFATVGMPGRLGPLDVPQASIDAILEPSLKNFNADPKQEFAKERDLLREVLAAAW